MSNHPQKTSTVLIFLCLSLVAITACGRAACRQPSAGQATSAPSGSVIANLGSTGQFFCNSWERPKPPVTPGNDLHRLTLRDPNALCNDGSPAVLYIKPAQDPAHSSEWVFHLQGGGNCGGYEECRGRWCGEDFYDAAKMSSQWNPDSIKGQGVFSTSPDNSFSGANQVFLYYCSSDNLIGQK